MNNTSREANLFHWLLAAASVVVIIAGIRAAQSLVVPFLVAAFLAVICTPALTWLKSKKVPSTVALLLVVVGVTLVLSSVVVVAGSSITDFVAKSGVYQEKLMARFDEAVDWMETFDIFDSTEDTEQTVPETSLTDDTATDDPNAQLPGPATATTGMFDPEMFRTILDPKKLFFWFSNFLMSISGLFSNALLVLLTLIFMLAEASGLPRKLVAITDGRRQLVDQSTRVRDAILHYMSLKTMVSVLTGVLAGLLVWALGVDYPGLWGLLAFFFNYVPSIGSFIAAIPPVLLALIQYDVKSALLMAAGYGLINGIIGNMVEPRIMGKGLGLSTLVVFLSLVFWGWVLGPVGMLLSVPLTMIVKIALENFEQTRWLAILLGSNPEPAK